MDTDLVTEVAGLRALHAVITPLCRANRGFEGAIDEALARIRAAFLDYAAFPANAEANWHVVLTVERHLPRGSGIPKAEAPSP